MLNSLLPLAALVVVLPLPSWSQARAEAPQTRPALFTGTSLAQPPQQEVPWSRPPGALSEKLITAVELLFAQGMADPRGCEYRQIEVLPGSVWGGTGQSCSTHGWVIPAPPVERQRFAVCWNGLVYPVISVGDRADFKGDIAAVVDKDRKQEQEQFERFKTIGKNVFPFQYHRSWGVTTEGDAISHETMTLLKACMLVRLGETALVESYWKQLSPKADEANEDPYLMLAGEFAWCVFNRAVCTHMRGDDTISLHDARLLTAAQPRIEAAAATRAFKRPMVSDPDNQNRTLPNAPYIGFLHPLPGLLADQERRFKDRQPPLSVLLADEADKFKAVHPRITLAVAAKIPDKTRRIEALIRCLEDVDERQWGQPGGVSIGSSPIVAALVKEGNEAVEPLLTCFENDNRLTRSVGFGRDFHPDRNLIPVASAAYSALIQIFQTRNFGAASDVFDRGGRPNRTALVKELRAFWEKGKEQSPAQRWYAALADDTAHPSQWVEAAKRIVQPVDVQEVGNWISEPARKPGDVPKIRGEELRNRKDPSVSELMAKRVPIIAGASQKLNSGAVFDAGYAAEVALALSQWDPKAAAPVLRAQIEDCKTKADYWSKHVSVSELGRNIADLSAALAKIEGKGALKEYAVFVRSQKPDPAGFRAAKIFEPMWQNPDDPDAVAAAEWAFNDPASPWRCLPKNKGMGGHNELIASPLLGLANFRKGVLANLADTSRVGVASVLEDRNRLALDSGSEGGFGFVDPEDPLTPKAGEQRIVRVCDWYALQISRLDGSPEFELFWTQDKRDPVIKQCIAFVQDWGDRFRYNELQKSLDNWGQHQVRMTFPKRTQPATEADVKAHTAIFSLSPAHARIVPLEPFPNRAKWTTLKKYRVLYGGAADPKTGKEKIISQFDQAGLVWQAEEVLENGQWKRYYGFVGRHIIAKVPADEIKLLTHLQPGDPSPE